MDDDELIEAFVQLQEMPEMTHEQSMALPLDALIQRIVRANEIMAMTRDAVDGCGYRIRDGLNAYVGMFRHVQKTTGASTGAECLRAMAERKIDPRVVELWIEQQIIFPEPISDALKAGYPEYKLKMSYFSDRYVAENLKGPKNI